MAVNFKLEVVPYLTQYFGGDTGRRVVIDQEAEPDETIGDFLRRLSTTNVELGKALWDAQTGGLGEHIELVINGEVLGRESAIDRPLAEGDVITLVPQYMGGA